MMSRYGTTFTDDIDEDLILARWAVRLVNDPEDVHPVFEYRQWPVVRWVPAEEARAHESWAERRSAARSKGVRPRSCL